MRLRNPLVSARIAEPTLQRALGLLMLGWIVVIFGIAVYGYSGTTFTSVVSFPESDGWCLGGSQTLGVHCFGDYGYARVRGGEKEVYASHNLDAANSPLIIIAFEGLRRLSYRTGLAIYMASLIGAVAVVAWWGARRRSALERSVLYFAAGIASLGAIVSFDRGNHVAWLAPLVLAYLIAVERRAWRIAIVSLALLAALKFWGILLIVVLLARRKYAAALQALGLTALLYLVPMLVLPGALPQKIKVTLSAVVSRDVADLVVRSAVSPYALVVRTACYARGQAGCDPAHPVSSVPAATAVAVALSLSLAAWAFTMCRTFEGAPLLAYAPAVSLAFLAVPEAGAYNLVMTVVMYALFARWECDRTGEVVGAGTSSDRKLAIWAVLIAMTVSTVPLPLILRGTSWPITPLGEIRVSYVLVPVVWLVVVGITSRLLIRERRASRHDQVLATL